MCLGGDKKTTTTAPTNAAINPAVTNLVDQATSLASNPLQPFTGQTVAPINATQQAGISGIQGAGSLAQPYLTQAASLAQNGATPITTTPFSADAVQQYESPYTADVLNTTEAAENQQDQQAQQSLAGNITAAGAWGGDRSTVLQSELAGQQSLANNQTNANIENQGYTQALGQFNTTNSLGVQTQQENNANALASASTLSGIGTNIQNSALTGANDLLAAGTTEQNTAQNQDTADYNQYLLQQAYPYQNLDFLSGILGNAASTSGTTSTAKTINPIGSTLLGLNGSKDGGRVRLASGGGSGVIPYTGVGMPPSTLPALSGYIPTASGSGGLSTAGTGGGGSASGSKPSSGGLLSGQGGQSFLWGNPATSSASASSGLIGTGGEGATLSSLGDEAGSAIADAGSAILAFLAKGGRTRLADGGTDSPDIGALLDSLYPDDGSSGPAVPPVADDKDPHPEVDHSGDTTLVRYADGSSLDTGIPTAPAGASAMSLADTPPAWQQLATNYATPPQGQSLSAPPSPAWDDGTPVASGPDAGQAADNWGAGLSRPAKIIQPAYTPQQPSLTRAILTGVGSLIAHHNIGAGLEAGANEYYGQMDKNNAPVIDKSGPTELERYPDGTVVDSGRPTEAAINANAMNTYRKTNMDTVNQTRQDAIGQRRDAATALAAARHDAIQQRAAAADQASKDREAQIKIAGINAGGSWTYAGVDPKTNMPVLLNNRTGETKLGNAPIAAKPAAGDLGIPVPATGAPTDAHGDAYLKTLPAAVQPVVKAMVEGRQPPPTSFAMSKPYWQQMIQAANQYDPGFDQTTWPSRVATRKSFTAGPDANNITAIDTALQHAGVVQNSLAALHNGSVPAINSAKNWMTQAFGGSAPTNAHEAVDALASEGRKVFAGTGGGNLQELENWQKNFPVNGSPEQQSGALSQFVNLLDSRMDAVADKYSRGMGNAQDKLTFLSPNARAVYTRLTGRKPVTGQASGNGAPLSLPNSGAGQKFQEGQTLHQNGHLFKVINGTPVDQGPN